LARESLFLSINELSLVANIKEITRDLHAIYSKSLIGNFKVKNHLLKNGQEVPYLKISPKPIGIQLYAVAHNKLEKWHNFSTIIFGNFSSINPLNFYGESINELLISADIKN